MSQQMFAFPDIYCKLIVLKIWSLAGIHICILTFHVQHYATFLNRFLPISNCTKSTAQYIFLYISSSRMVHNSHVSEGLQKLTVADLQYILRTTGLIMYLKQVKCPRFWCNGNVFVTRSAVQRMVEWRCAVTVGVQRMVQWRCAVTVGVQRMVQWRCAVNIGVQRIVQWRCAVTVGVQRMVQWRCAVTVGVQRMVQWRCAVTVGVKRMVQWRLAVNVGVQRMVQWRCAVTVLYSEWYSDGLLWLSVQWPSKCVIPVVCVKLGEGM